MLIDGVEMDLTTTRYETWEELRTYCQSGRVGRRTDVRAHLRLSRSRRAGARRRSRRRAAADQHPARRAGGRRRSDASICRRTSSRAFGITEGALLDGGSRPAGTRSWRCRSHRARQLHASGIRVTESIPKQPAACVRTMAGIYDGILEKIEATPELPLRGRARLSTAAKLGVMVRSWLAAYEREPRSRRRGRARRPQRGARAREARLARRALRAQPAPRRQRTSFEVDGHEVDNGQHVFSRAARQRSTCSRSSGSPTRCTCNRASRRRCSRATAARPPARGIAAGAAPPAGVVRPLPAPDHARPPAGRSARWSPREPT